MYGGGHNGVSGMSLRFNILPMITEQKPCERQILINVWPMQTLFVNFDVVQLFRRCVFKSPIPSNWKAQYSAIWKRNMKNVIGKKRRLSINQSIHAICSLWFPRFLLQVPEPCATPRLSCLLIQEVEHRLTHRTWLFQIHSEHAHGLARARWNRNRN